MNEKRIADLRGLVQHLRARNGTTPAAVVSEALDEIERLRAEVATLHRGYVDLHEMMPGGMDVWTKVGRLRDVESAAREYIRYLDSGDLVAHGGALRRDAIRSALNAVSK